MQAVGLLQAVKHDLTVGGAAHVPDVEPATLVAVPAAVAVAAPGLVRGALVHRAAELANDHHDHNCGLAVAAAVRRTQQTSYCTH